MEVGILQVFSTEKVWMVCVSPNKLSLSRWWPRDCKTTRYVGPKYQERMSYGTRTLRIEVNFAAPSTETSLQ